MKHRLSNLSKIYRDDICRKMNILPIVLCMFCMGNAYSLMAATPSVSETLQQNRKIKGRVVDVNNEPMIGVSVLEKGTTNGVITDFDGIVTDNCVYIGANGEMSRKLNFKDVMGFSILRKNGYRIGIISGEKNSAIEIISKKFNVEEVHQGIRVKIDVIKSIVERYNLSEEEFVYIGDDINDYDSLTYAKYRVTVPDAVDKIKNIKDIQITEARGGDGAFREVVDALMSTSVDCKHKF